MLFHNFFAKKAIHLKLHIGCGNVRFEGWINIDKESRKGCKRLDVRKNLPYDDNCVEFIYNEHVIEHFTAKEGLKVLKEFYRVLTVDGVLRIATPDLDYVIEKYNGSWQDQVWLKNYTYIQTRAEMLNTAFRNWEHQYLYNEEELTRRLKEAGFKKIYRKVLNESDYKELRNRETRPDSTLILEAVK